MYWYKLYSVVVVAVVVVVVVVVAIVPSLASSCLLLSCYRLIDSLVSHISFSLGVGCSSVVEILRHVAASSTLRTTCATE